jgi:FAD/FMN-containing dehydrogenase
LDRTGFGRSDEWDGLRHRLHGDLVLPSDSAYPVAKQLQISEYDAINPQGIAYCISPDDVRTCIGFADSHGIPVRVRAGGHNLRGWSTGSGLVIDVSKINHATVTNDTVHVGPGTQSVDALAKLEPFDRQLVCGTCPTVSMGGFLSGGGIGFQTRKFGTGSDRVVSALVVLADGRIVRCSADEEPDLYWAVRGGGGGNFGVVVDFEVRPIDAPRMVTFSTIWPWDHAPGAFAAWQEWLIQGSRNLGSSAMVIPALDAQSPTPLLRFYGGYLGPQSELETALADLANAIGVKPLSTDVTDLTYHQAMRKDYHCDQLTEAQCHRVDKDPGGVLLRTPFERQSYQFLNRGLTPGEAGSVFSTWDTHPSLDHRYLQCIAVGGAANDVDPDESAFVHRDARFLLGYQAFLLDARADVDTPAAVADLDAWTDGAADQLARFSSGSYINFPSSKTLPNWRVSTYGENYDRLVDVKDRYDPADFFQHPQSIGS